MDAKIIDVADVGNGVVLVRITITDGNERLNYNNVYWQGLPCVELLFPVPVTQGDYVTYLQGQISKAVGDLLTSKLIERNAQNAAAIAVSRLSTSFIGTVVSLNTVTMGNVSVAVDGTVTKLNIVDTTLAIPGI